jgi:transglycosylase-like protein with SLT domain
MVSAECGDRLAADRSMNNLIVSRPFQERLLDGYQRSQLRRDVLKVKPRQCGSLRKTYVIAVLGVSLVMVGVTVPLNIYEALSAHRLATTSTGEDSASSRSGVPAIAESEASEFFVRHVPFGSVIYSEARKNNVSPVLVAAVARAESSFSSTARSHRGAIGVMQLLPRTGRWLGATDLTNPVQNIVAGAKYLGYLNDRFDGNEEHVIAAYNAGEGNVRRFGGVPPFAETRDYIQRVHRFQRDLLEGMTGRQTARRHRWSVPVHYLQRLGAVAERSRPKIDLHWTTAGERRARLLMKRMS